MADRRFHSTFRRRSRLWVCAGLLLGATLVHAEPMSIQVQGGMDGSTGGSTFVTPGLMGPSVDFGYVANLGPQPNTGARVDLEGGASLYVATFELRVEVEVDHTLWVSSSGVAPSFSTPEVRGLDDWQPVMNGFDSPGLVLPSQDRRRSAVDSRFPAQRSGASSTRGGTYIPAASASAGERVGTVDLYVRLNGMAMGGSVQFFGTGRDTDWTHGGGVELSFHEVLVASNIPVGEPYVCQLALRVGPEQWGVQGAGVVFSARPAGR